MKEVRWDEAKKHIFTELVFIDYLSAENELNVEVYWGKQSLIGHALRRLHPSPNFLILILF